MYAMGVRTPRVHLAVRGSRQIFDLSLVSPTTVGFCGFLVGPAVIGLISKFFGPPVALSVVALLGRITAVCDPAVIRAHAPSRETSQGQVK
jgi:hypothetical protein